MASCPICGSIHLTGHGKKDGDWCDSCEACLGLRELDDEIKRSEKNDDGKSRILIEDTLVPVFCLAKVIRYTARQVRESMPDVSGLHEMLERRTR